MPEIPNSSDGEPSIKKNKKYIKQALKSQEKDKINISGTPRSR
jgi:hypothetical protein